MEQETSSQTLALSLFSGAGGMDIGIRQGGFHIIGQIENDEYACSTLRHANQKEAYSTRVFQQDIQDIKPHLLKKRLLTGSQTLDLLFGGPPCQAFSQIGKRKGLEDARGILLFEMVRFAEAFHPSAILIEQVTGLLTAKDQDQIKGGILAKLVSDLETLGYTVSWQIINMADYGLPQLRKRLFIVALQNGKLFEFPAPTHSQQMSLFSDLKRYTVVGDVICDLDEPSSKANPRFDSHVDVTPAGDRYRIQGVPEGAYLAAQTHLPPEQIKNLTTKDTTKFLRTSYSEPSKTLRCGEIFFHPDQDRYLTPREYMRIQGFPDDYILMGPIRGRSGRVQNLDQYRQIANSVPPPIAKILAEHIQKALSCPKSMNSTVTP